MYTALTFILFTAYLFVVMPSCTKGCYMYAGVFLHINIVYWLPDLKSLNAHALMSFLHKRKVHESTRGLQFHRMTDAKAKLSDTGLPISTSPINRGKT